MKRAPVVWWIFVLGLLLFLFAPAVIVVLFSFNAVSSTSLPFQGFSLRWYRAAFSDSLFREALRNSVVVAGATAILVAVLGANASFALTRRPSRLTNAFTSFVTTPLVVPGLFLGVALLSFFNAVGIRLSLVTVIVGHAVITMPFVVLIVNARLLRLDRSIEEAARDLGAGPFESFRRVLFPLVRSALFGAMLIAIAWSFDEFIVTFFTIGGNPTLPIMIWGMLRRGVNPSVNAIASIILGTTILATLIVGWLISGRELIQRRR